MLNLVTKLLVKVQRHSFSLNYSASGSQSRSPVQFESRATPGWTRTFLTPFWTPSGQGAERGSTEAQDAKELANYHPDWR